jgi:hypothetical protein
MIKVNILYLVFLFACSPKTVNNTETPAVNTNQTTELPKDRYEGKHYWEKDVNEGYLPIYGNDLIDSLIIGFLKKPSEIDTIKKEYGGGDCDGEYFNLFKKGSRISVLLDGTSCGEYGYDVTHYYLSNDSIISIRKFNFGILKFPSDTNSTVYELKEKIFYFNKENFAVIKERNKITENNKDSAVTDQPFLTKQYKGDSIYKSEIKEYRELLVKERFE